MDVRNLKLDFDCFTNGGPAIVRDVAPDNPYRNGERIPEEVIGRKVTCVFPANKYDTLVVRVSDPTDALSVLLERATIDNPLMVTFENFSATLYTMKTNDGYRFGVSAKASAVRPVLSHNNDQILDI